ncbi:uncharacterized protein LOC136035315 [Artemia franciscana]|uniref:Uncharacterized protein n=1 Tax=Artemia franciscana TaxID=6661 RepID=A0AA88L7Z1_ARTSF|nr:hypothetical protein QYM36_003929 [Artemia franciscana]
MDPEVVQSPTASPKRYRTDESPLNNFHAILDHYEVMVDHLKQQAHQIEQEREFLLSSMESVMNGSLISQLNDDEKKTANEQLSKIIDECMGINVKVSAKRTPREEEALDRVNIYINNLVMNVNRDTTGARQECIDALKSLIPEKLEETEKLGLFSDIHPSLSFEDRQKTIHRLRGLMSYIQSLQQQAVQMLE